MSNPSQPYKLGSGKSVGDAAAKAGAEIGTAISEGVQAVTGVKKHRNTLAHLASEAEKNRAHVRDTINQSAEIAERLGGKTRISSTAEGAVDFSHKGKKRNRNLSAAQHDGTPPPSDGPKNPPAKPQLALPPAGPRAASPSDSGSGAPSKPEPKPANPTVKPMLALPPGKSSALKESNSRTMRDFNQKKREVRQRAAADRAAGGRPKRSTPRTVAGKKYGSSMPTIIESLDQSRETTNKNVDKAWAYLANKRKQEKKRGTSQ